MRCYDEEIRRAAYIRLLNGLTIDSGLSRLYLESDELIEDCWVLGIEMEDIAAIRRQKNWQAVANKVKAMVPAECRDDE
jgi:hypothetical protein